jgi:hypothetical protein
VVKLRTRSKKGDQFRFIGQDGSLGYRNGQVYRLYFKVAGDGHIIAFSLEDAETHSCPYTVAGFMENWELVK